MRPQIPSRTPDCGDPEHRRHRRRFLQGLAGAGVVSTLSWSGLFSAPAFADQARRAGKRCILLWLTGGPSQFETWDPKPGTETGGPFRSIPTRTPGVHFSELLPRCAAISDKLAVIRSMRTGQSEHFQGISLLQRGADERPPFTRPTLGSVIARQLGRLDTALPSFVLLDPCPEGNEFKAFKAGDWAGWLGAEYAPLRTGGEFRLPDVDRLAEIADADHEEREALRAFLTRRYAGERDSRAARAHNAVFERARGLMQSAHLFDLERLPPRDRERYGPGAFAQHALLARSLVEEGVPFVMVANGMPWDTHVFNHEIYQMVVPELDNVVYQLVQDLEERGMLDSTLVAIMGEFGRTPWINVKRGRDHYSKAWSLALAGCGIRPGVVVGETDRRGIEVVGEAYDEKNLFATLFTALGIDPHTSYDLPDLPDFHLVEEEAEPIREVLV